MNNGTTYIKKLYILKNFFMLNYKRGQRFYTYWYRSIVNLNIFANIIIYHPRINILPYIKYNKSLKEYFYKNIYDIWIERLLSEVAAKELSPIYPYDIKKFLSDKKRFIDKHQMYNVGITNKINHKQTTVSKFNNNVLRVLHQSTRRELKDNKYIDMHYHRYIG